MSQLIIADLDFLAREFCNSSEVKGGKKSPKLSAALDADLATDFDAYLKVKGTKYAYAAGSAVAAASASAVSTKGPAKAKVKVDAKVKLS